MKLRKIIFTFLILLLAFQICPAQEKPKAELIDEFGNLDWDDFALRLDSLFNHLIQKPNSTAYIVIHNGKVPNDRQRFLYEELAKAHIRFRQYDEKRITIIRAADQDNALIQFWIVPEAGEKPFFTKVKWNLVLPQKAKPFIFTTTEADYGVIGAPAEYLSLNLFSEYLEANPLSRGHFVIRAQSKAHFRKEKAEILKLLIGKYQIPSKRLRFFYVRENKPNRDYSPVKVWLVPQKK